MAKLDAEQVRLAAAGRWHSILQSVGGIAPELLDSSKEHPCPKCGGETRFRLVDENAGAVRCSHCFSTKCGDGFAAIGWLLGLSFPDAVARVADYCGIAVKKSADPAKDLVWQDWSSALVAHFLMAKPGVTEEGLLLSGARMARYKNQFTVIALPIVGQGLDYSEPVGWAVMNYNAAPLPTYNRQGVQIGQTKVKLTAGSKPGLVGRHALERLPVPGLAELVWKVEGVSDLVALQSIIPEHLRDRHLVVTNANGSKETPRWPATTLAAVNCNVIHDADEPGVDGAKNWATQIAAQSAEGLKVRIVNLPYEIAKTHGKDLRDWINEGRTYADLLTLADQAEPLAVARTATGEIDYTGVEYPVQKKILEKLQLEVLYEEENCSVRVFSLHNRKSSTIRQIDRLRKETLIQICGPPAKELVSREPDGESTFSIDDVREAIALAASNRRGKNDERGVGVWQGLDNWGNETNTVVLVGNTEGARWNGDKVLRRIVAPRADGLVLDFGAQSADWYDFETLERYLQEAGDVDWRAKVIDEAESLFNRWRWRNQDVDPLLITGLVLASWVQTIWEWRPLVSISGESNAGKSFLFEALGGSNSRRGIFGSLAFKQAKSTAAGFMQGLNNTARVALNDEFEASRERTKVLEALRQSTRGEATAKGTAHHKGVQFALRHIAWVAAIETGLDRQPDMNRFIQFELKRAPAGEHGKLRLPDGRQLADLGQKLLAIAVRGAIEAKKLAVTLKDTHIDGVDPRTVESYAVPAAMLTMAAGEDEAWARGMIGKLVENVDKADQGKVDHEELLNDILTAGVNVGGRQGVMTVAQVLESPSNRLDYGPRLEVAGVKITNDNELFIVPRLVSQHLMRGTSWEGQKIDQILLRLPGAKRQQLRIGGRPARGLVIPAGVVQLAEQPSAF